MRDGVDLPQNDRLEQGVGDAAGCATGFVAPECGQSEDCQEIAARCCQISTLAGANLDAGVYDQPVQEMGADTRLAVYGTLRPGESNHAMLADVPGEWLSGTVEGVRFMAKGYPAFRPGAGQVAVSVLTSAALPEHWARLDEFEGADYRRILVPVTLSDGGTVVANLYAYIAP